MPAIDDIGPYRFFFIQPSDENRHMFTFAAIEQWRSTGLIQ
jgi:hypothetical protein